MKLLFTTAFICLSALCFAQRQNVYFLKNNGKYVDVRDSADYIRVVREPDSASKLYKIAEFYPNGVSKLLGKSSRIDPPLFEGQCVRYYASGKRKSMISYSMGIIVGDAFEFYPNGKPYLSKKYPDKPDMTDLSENHYLIIAEYDSLGTKLFDGGNGHYLGYDDHFKKVTEEGDVQNGLRSGVWTGRDAGAKVGYTETYDNGKLVSGISVGEKGDSIKYSQAREQQPQYKGGLTAFYRYLGKHVEYPDYERGHNIEGSVVLQFVVERTGKITGIQVMHSVSEGIDKEAVRVVGSCPDWIPGTEYGRNVRVSYTIPLSFALK